ncbi:hypothetical protein KAU09_02655 [Candidatus Parcubacteria bacterium]|nr:hypothetical protein [Candidatus Parcubacteria bacterium]
MLEKIKNISIKKVFEIITILAYTCLNLHIINTIISMEYWWSIIMQMGGAIIFIGIIIGLFLNAGLILYYLHKK